MPKVGLEAAADLPDSSRMKTAPAILFAILLALLSQARAATTNTVILNLSSFG